MDGVADSEDLSFVWLCGILCGFFVVLFVCCRCFCWDVEIDRLLLTTLGYYNISYIQRVSMRLPNSASIFTAEIWAIINALEEMKTSVASKYIVFTDSLSSLQALQSMKLEHESVSFKILTIKTLFFVGYLDILVLEVSKRQTLLPSLH